MRKAYILVNSIKAGVLEELSNGKYKFVLIVIMAPLFLSLCH